MVPWWRHCYQYYYWIWSSSSIGPIATNVLLDYFAIRPLVDYMTPSDLRSAESTAHLTVKLCQHYPTMILILDTLRRTYWRFGLRRGLSFLLRREWGAFLSYKIPLTRHFLKESWTKNFQWHYFVLGLHYFSTETQSRCFILLSTGVTRLECYRSDIWLEFVLSTW